MKVFRDWQISGDLDWLKKMYPLANVAWTTAFDLRWNTRH